LFTPQPRVAGDGDNPAIRRPGHTVLSKIFSTSLLTPFDPAILLHIPAC
jgi:hypothetical protein